MTGLKTLLIPAFFSLNAGYLNAQEPCAAWPADCPDNSSIENAQSVSVRMTNGLTRAEIEQQDKARQIIIEMMQDIADKLNWQLTELEANTGLAGFQKSNTPAALRSPRGIEFYFQFVVDEDTLKNWKEWKTADFERRSTAGKNAGQPYIDVMNSPQFKQYMDSSNHYKDLYLAYMEQHKSDGLSILTDKTSEKYSKKMNDYSDKAMALQTQTVQQNGWKELEDEGKLITHRFRNAAIINVHVAANAYNAEANDAVNIISEYAAAGAKIARQARIRGEESGYYHELGKWNNMILLLLGNWSNKKINGSYRAGFSENGQGDDRTPKKISSDKIQNLAIYIMGNRANIERAVRNLDLGKLNGLITAN